MNPAERKADLPIDDPLLELELRVAWRADEISHESGGGRDKDLEYWLQAEREVLSHACFSAFR
jgi:hypothetical protein